MKVLKFGAVWCPGCLVMRPRWEKIEAKNDWLKTEYFDIDEFPEMKEKYELKEYPTAIWLDENEQEIARLEGEVSEVEILDLINKYESTTLSIRPRAHGREGDGPSFREPEDTSAS